MEQNPYAAPQPTPNQFSPYQQPPAQGAGFVQQIRIVSIMMIVEGVLELLMGILLTFAGFAVIFFQENEDFREAFERQQDLEPDFLGAIYLGIGLFCIAVSLFRIFAGIMNFQYKGRILGLVANLGGMIMLLSCYCAPTAIGLGIYCAIVYFQSSVVQAFELRRQGHTHVQIMQHFLGGNPKY